MMRPLTLLVAASMAAAPALAREVTEDDRAAVADLIEQVDAAMGDGDVFAVMGFAPPALLDVIAKPADLPPEKVHEAMNTALKEAMGEAGTKIEGVSVEMRLSEAEAGQTSTGRPYLVVPTETVMKVRGDMHRDESDTLALEDGGKWYLVQIDDVSQLGALLVSYPDFMGADFLDGGAAGVR